MKWLLNILNIPYCKKCGSIRLDHSLWIGGWNLLCEQATARTGTRCFDCGDIIWDQTDEDYEQSLPEWCVSDRELIKLKYNGNWEKTKQKRKYSREGRKSD